MCRPLILWAAREWLWGVAPWTPLNRTKGSFLRKPFAMDRLQPNAGCDPKDLRGSRLDFRFWGKLGVVLFLVLGSLLAHAQGGPPFRTDDPGTPGTNNWELNIGFVGTRNPASGSYQV